MQPDPIFIIASALAIAVLLASAATHKVRAPARFARQLADYQAARGAHGHGFGARPFGVDGGLQVLPGGDLHRGGLGRQGAAQQQGGGDGMNAHADLLTDGGDGP